MIRFTAKEKKEFDKIEKEAQDWYLKFRSVNVKKMSKYYLKVSSKLTPLRIACSGGKYPIYSENDNAEDAVDEDSKGMDINMDADKNGEKKQKTKKKTTRETVYSKFVFKSKFNALLAQLKKIRDKEPNCKFF